MKSALVFLGIISLVCMAISVLSRRSNFDRNELDFLGRDEEVEKIVNSELKEGDRNV